MSNRKPFDRVEKILLGIILFLVLFFVYVFATMGQQRLKDYDLVRKDYFKVVIEGDTVEQGFANLYTAEQYLRNYADTVVISSTGTEIVGMNFHFRPEYEDIDEGTLQSLLLKDVNWQHSQDPDSSSYYIRVSANSIADSVNFHYTGFDSSGLVLDVSHTKTPISGTVRDTLFSDFQGSIQLDIEAYYGTSFTEESLLIDTGFIGSLPTDLKKKTI